MFRSPLSLGSECPSGLRASQCKWERERVIKWRCTQENLWKPSFQCIPMVEWRFKYLWLWVLLMYRWWCRIRWVSAESKGVVCHQPKKLTGMEWGDTTHRVSYIIVLFDEFYVPWQLDWNILSGNGTFFNASLVGVGKVTVEESCFLHLLFGWLLESIWLPTVWNRM